MREQLLNGERFSTRKGAQSPTERGRIHDHTVRAAQQSRGPATRSRNHPACELRTNMVGGTKNFRLVIPRPELGMVP